jgi:hypothetical protein
VVDRGRLPAASTDHNSSPTSTDRQLEKQGRNLQHHRPGAAVAIARLHAPSGRRSPSGGRLRPTTGPEAHSGNRQRDGSAHLNLDPSVHRAPRAHPECGWKCGVQERSRQISEERLPRRPLTNKAFSWKLLGAAIPARDVSSS